MNHSIQKERVSFKAHGLTIAGILFTPTDIKGPLPAIVTTHPASSCKDQTASIYAEKLAQAGYVTLTFDASFQGESEGTPRYLEIPEYRVDDIRGAVDFLISLPIVDNNRIGALGICAGGGYTVNAAMTDRRIKAVGTVVGVNLGRLYRESSPFETLNQIATQRNKEVEGGEESIINWIPTSPEAAKNAGITDIDVLEAVDYYTTPRGQHVNSPNKVNLLSFASVISFDAFNLVDVFLTQPLQIIIGGKQGGFNSYGDGHILYERAASVDKDLYIIENTSHYELYDQPEPVRKAVEKLTSFYNSHL